MPRAIRQPSDELPVTVVVADDHPVILEGLIKILNSQRDIRVVASAADGEEVSKLYYQFLPNVLLIDLRLPKEEWVAGAQGADGAWEVQTAGDHDDNFRL